MIRRLSLLLSSVFGSSVARAQGIKDQPSGTQPTSATRSGTATNSGSETMSGAFKGAGKPIYGISPGTGFPKKTRNQV